LALKLTKFGFVLTANVSAAVKNKLHYVQPQAVLLLLTSNLLNLLANKFKLAQTDSMQWLVLLTKHLLFSYLLRL
jgi:hypothetical protein